MPAQDSVTISVQHTCLPNGAGAELRVTVRSFSRSTPQNPASVSVGVAGPGGLSDNAGYVGASKTFVFSPVPDGPYTLTATDHAGQEAARTYVIACGGAGPVAAPTNCDLAISQVVATAATEPGGTGSLTAVLSTTAPPIRISVTRLSDNVTDQLAGNFPPGPFQLYRAPIGAYRLRLTDARGCVVSEDYSIAAPATEPEQPEPPTPPTRFHAVGGLLPRPALLDTPVSTLLNTQGQPRRGLHVEVELSREGSPVPFTTLRQTVRRLAEQTDAAPLLASLLSPGKPAPAGLLPYIDRDTTAAFAYRWREADADGAGPWQQARGNHVALLSALAPDESEARFVANNPTIPASPLSAFPSGQLVQHAGYPLALTVWLPDSRAGDWFSEFRFLDQAGNEVGIYSYLVPAYLPAGMLRCELRGSPLPPCAASVEFRLTDTDRSYSHTCASGPSTPPASGPHDFNISDLSDSDFL